MTTLDNLYFVQVEDDPNLEVIEFVPRERYLLRSMNPDEPTEKWTYHRKGCEAEVVYNGGLLPKSIINKMIRLTLEGREFDINRI